MSIGEQEQSQGNLVNPPANCVHSTQAAGLRRFTFLAVKMSASQAASTASDVNQDSVLAQLNQYVAVVRDSKVANSNGLEYGHNTETCSTPLHLLLKIC